MSKIVAAARERSAVMQPRQQPESFSLYAPSGARKYLNHAERQRMLAVMATLPVERALFCLTLAWTGARVSEVLALSASSFQTERGVVALRTLKRRRHHVREVPIPPELMSALERHLSVRAAQRDEGCAERRLWPWCRATAWRLVATVMTKAGITGAPACPRGLRHGFAVAALQAGVPLNIVQRWLGHSRMSTTAIYADVCGAEEQALAGKLWRRHSLDVRLELN
jgi:integrase/recombinase XerD